MYNELLPSQTFNTQASRSGALIPGQLRTDAAELIKFIEEYYRLSNNTGNPSNLVNDFLREHDIDSVTDPFFTGIQNLIAKTIPNSNVFDRQTLYKRIIDFYSLRGSEVSVKAFFKIFYNQNSSVSYPKNDLLKPSSGNFFREQLNYNGWYAARKMYTAAEMLPLDSWNNPNITDFQTSETGQSSVNWTASRIESGGNGYIDTNGFASESRLKLQDSYFWQDYSYVVYNSMTSDVWSNNFLRLVHPAGLKYFHVIRLEIYILNFWNEEFIYEKDQHYWVKLPPNKSPDFFYDKSQKYGYHSPINQPGVVDYYKLPLDIMSSDDVYVPKDQFISEVTVISDSEISISKSISNFYTMNQLNMNSTDYMNQLKFIDTSIIAGFGSHVIEPLTIDTTHSYSPRDGLPYSYRFPPTAIGAFITSVGSVALVDTDIDGIVVGEMTQLSIGNNMVTKFNAAGDISDVTAENIYYKLRFRFTNHIHHNKLVNITQLVSGTTRQMYKFQLKCNPRDANTLNWNSATVVTTYSHILLKSDSASTAATTNYDNYSQSNPYYFIIYLLSLENPNAPGFITWDSMRWHGKDRSDISFDIATPHADHIYDHNGNTPYISHLASDLQHDHERDDHLFGTAYNYTNGSILDGYINTTSNISYDVSINRTVPTTYMPILPIVYGTTNTFNDNIVSNDIINGNITYQSPNADTTVTVADLMPFKAVGAVFVLNVDPILP